MAKSIYYSFLINEHSPKENETSFALKNVVFDKTPLKLALMIALLDAKIFNDYATNLNVFSLAKVFVH